MSRLTKSGVLQFSLDRADNEAIAGWVINTSGSDIPVNVEIRQGNKVLWSSDARDLRTDLRDAGVSNGENGFHCQLSEEISQPIKGNVDVFAGEQKLNDEDIFLDFQPLAKKNGPNIVPDHFVYNFDSIKVNAIYGWARVRGDDDQKLSVECRVGDIVVGSVLANKYREDLKLASVGDGQCSFTLKPDFSLLPEKESRFALYLNGNLVPFDQFSMVMSADDIKQQKLSLKLAEFTSSVKKEIDCIRGTIQKHNMNNGLPIDGVSGVCNVLIEKIAEVNTRVAVIETAILKHLKE